MDDKLLLLTPILGRVAHPLQFVPLPANQRWLRAVSENEALLMKNVLCDVCTSSSPPSLVNRSFPPRAHSPRLVRRLALPVLKNISLPTYFSFYHFAYAEQSAASSSNLSFSCMAACNTAQ